MIDRGQNYRVAAIWLFIASAAVLISGQFVSISTPVDIPDLGVRDVPSEGRLALRSLMGIFGQFGLYAAALLFCTGTLISNLAGSDSRASAPAAKSDENPSALAFWVGIGAGALIVAVIFVPQLF